MNKYEGDSIHATKVYKGSRSVTPIILTFGTIWRSAVNRMPRPPLCTEEHPDDC